MPVIREAGAGIQALRNVEVDSATAALVLEGHILDADIMKTALDRAIGLVEAVCRVEARASQP